VCERLDKLTEKQWRDLFQGAGYDAATGGRFTAALRRRIREGLQLPTRRSPAPAGEGRH
jgi:hypothetical protein